MEDESGGCFAADKLIARVLHLPKSDRVVSLLSVGRVSGGYRRLPVKSERNPSIQDRREPVD